MMPELGILHFLCHVVVAHETDLATRLDVDKAAEVAHKAHAEGITLKEALLAMKLLSAAEADRLLDPEPMTRGGLPGSAGGHSARGASTLSMRAHAARRFSGSRSASLRYCC